MFAGIPQPFLSTDHGRHFHRHAGQRVWVRALLRNAQILRASVIDAARPGSRKVVEKEAGGGRAAFLVCSPRYSAVARSGGGRAGMGTERSFFIGPPQGRQPRRPRPMPYPWTQRPHTFWRLFGLDD